jgi:dUTP pyrophosphatase
MAESLLSIKKLRPDAVIPEYKSDAAAGLDLAAAIDAPVEIPPGGHAMIPTGLAVAIADGHEGQVRPRSGLAADHQVTVLNAPGTVDSDFRGEVRVILINHGRAPFVVKRGERIAQLVVAPVSRVQIRVVDELPATRRGEGGFGSTGR